MAMNFRTLLVHLDTDARCDARIHLAARFAAANDAHLTGLAPTGLVDLPAELGAAAQQLSQAALAHATARRAAEEIAVHFRNRCDAEGVKSCDAFVDNADKAQSLLQQAHCADLLVIGQPDPGSPDFRTEQQFMEQVVLHNARPTLVVPNHGRFDGFGGRVLIAWDDSREAARAVADALPMLRHAKQVMLHVWRHRKQESELPAVRQRLDNVHRWLMRQGVACDARALLTAQPIGEAVLADATDSNTDLVVMGAYGHARWTQRLLGGTTRTVLSRMAVPVFVSH